MIWGYVLAAALSFGAAWQIQDWRMDAKMLEQKQKAEKAQADQEARGDGAAKGLEGDKAKIEIRYKTITKTVEKIVERPVYKNVCLDQDGIDAINGVEK